jgi:hypothetical protein
MTVVEKPVPATAGPDPSRDATLSANLQRRSQARFVAGGLSALALIAALTAARGSWVGGLVSLLLVLTVPGLLLLRALRVPGDAIAGFPVYVPCASIVVLLASGLMTDLAGFSLLGIEHPLRPAPLLAGLEIVCLGLLAMGAAAAPAAQIPWRSLVFRWRGRIICPLMLPAFAAAGALQLTNGQGRTLAIVAAAAIGGAIFVGMLFAQRMSRVQLGVLVYAIALAAVWSFSLRGRFVYGFDITSEYHVITSTYGAGVWHRSHSGDAYGAMLSLTILAPMLHVLSGASILVLLKAVYPALLALVPLAVFLMASRLVPRVGAFAAAAFVLASPYFFQQMPGIARQEIALVLFVALVHTAIDWRLPRRQACALAVLLALALVVSHYSTTYLAIAMLSGTLVLHAPLSRVRPALRSGAVLGLAFVALTSGAGLWYVAITNSASNVEDVTAGFRKNGFALLPNTRPGESLMSSYLDGNVVRKSSARAYEQLITREYAKTRASYVRPLPVANAQRIADARTSDPSVSAPAVNGVLGTAQVLISQIGNLAAVFFALVLLLRRRSGRQLRLIALLGVSLFMALAFVRLSGTAANAYNPERAFVQSMVPLAICVGWGVSWFAHFRFGRVASALAALALLLLFVSGSGLRAAIAGGRAPVNLAQRGEDFDRFYVSATERASARWFGLAPHGALLYADRYGVLRVIGTTGREGGLLHDVVPTVLDRHAWVYASNANVAGRARGQTQNASALYTWPSAYLDRYYKTVYTNGGSKVYKR